MAQHPRSLRGSPPAAAGTARPPASGRQPHPRHASPGRGRSPRLRQNRHEGAHEASPAPEVSTTSTAGGAALAVSPSPPPGGTRRPGRPPTHSPRQSAAPARGGQLRRPPGTARHPLRPRSGSRIKEYRSPPARRRQLLAGAAFSTVAAPAGPRRPEAASVAVHRVSELRTPSEASPGRRRRSSGRSHDWRRPD